MAVGEHDDRSGLGQHYFAAVTRRQVLERSSLGISVKDAVEEVGQVRFQLGAVHVRSFR